MSETEATKSTAIAISAGPRGLQLNTMKEMWQFANALTVSGMAPKGLEKPEACLVAMQLGAELGFGPMMSLQNIAVINGRPTVWGDVMLGLCRTSGLFDEEAFSEKLIGTEGSDDWAGVCTVRRLGGGKPITRTFSVRMAKRAGLWDRRSASGKPLPWQQYPERMLQMRARSWGLKDEFPDVLKGLYSAEEARDIVVETVPSDEHMAQAREAREAEAIPDPVRFAFYAGRVSKAITLYELDAVAGSIKGDPVLSETAEKELTKQIAYRKTVVLGSPDPVPDPDPEQTELVLDPEPTKQPPPPQPPSVEHTAIYKTAIAEADSLTVLDSLETRIKPSVTLTDEDKRLLLKQIGGQKVIIRGSRGSRSNVPSA